MILYAPLSHCNLGNPAVPDIFLHQHVCRRLSHPMKCHPTKEFGGGPFQVPPDNFAPYPLYYMWLRLMNLPYYLIVVFVHYLPRYVPLKIHHLVSSPRCHHLPIHQHHYPVVIFALFLHPGLLLLGQYFGCSGCCHSRCSGFPNPLHQWHWGHSEVPAL